MPTTMELIAMEAIAKEWSEIVPLFDNGQYSVISAQYRGARVLGQRTNDENVWHVIPSFLELPILHGLLEERVNNGGRQIGNNPAKWIEQEIEMRKRRADRSSNE